MGQYLKYLILTVLVLLLIPLTGRRNHQKYLESFKGAPVRSALMLGDFDNLPKGYLTGFNYELLKMFGESHSDSTVIFLGDPEASYFDSLRTGSLDILVMPGGEVPVSKDLLPVYPIDSSVAWLIKKSPYKGHEIIRWTNSLKGTAEYGKLVRRFFNGYNPYRNSSRDPSILSPYDDLIKKNARTIGWDWRLLAALIWNESMFRIQARSPKGAVGLMQMMPHTADRFGVEDMLDPEENISAGTRYLDMLQKFFSSYTEDREMLVNLAIASYNCGEGRTLEDLDGREQSAETAAYVKSVLNQYDFFRGVEPRYQEAIDTVSVTSELLRPDGLGGIDPGDEHAGDEQEEHDDQE